MSSRRLAPTLLLALAAAFSGAQSKGWTWNWLENNVFDRIQITGRRELGYHMQSIDGDRQAFRDLTYYGRGGRRFTDHGQISIDGRNVFGVLNFQMQISDNRYSDPESRRISIDYKKGPYSLSLGDIQGSLLNTNSLASFSRSLRGASAGYQNGRFAARAVRSEAKGSATTISIAGENSTGPYFLQSSRIVKDSVRVQVDGQEMKLGDDYTVNYDIGSVTFNKKIVPPTSSIAVTYEALGFNGGLGTIEGYGASYDFGRFGKIGYTSLEQKPNGVRGLNSRTDLFQGFGDPSTPYFLSYEPLRSRPIIVKLQGIVQVEGVHYRFDSLNPAVFYFLFPVPATSNVDVTYTPKPVQTVDGNRKVVGWDYKLPLGEAGSITYNQATGSVKSEGTGTSGTARKIAVSYDLGKIRLKTSASDIPNTFVGIQSTGFLRNEKSVDFSADSESGPFSYGISGANRLIGTRATSTGDEIKFTNARTTEARAYVRYSKSDNQSWGLSHLRSTSRTLRGETKLDTTSLSNTWKSGRLSTNLGYDRTQGRAPLTDVSGTKMSSLALDTMRLGIGYDAGKQWALNAHLGASDVKTSEHSGHGTDVSLNAEYRPSTKLNVQLSVVESKSGALSALAGFENGYGVGYGGNGFSSGVSTIGGLTGSAGGDYKSNSIAVTYQVSPKINLATRLTDSSSSGSISSNSSTKGISVDVDADLGGGTTTGLSLTKSETKFLSSATGSTATTLDWYLVGAPKGPWSYKLGTTYLLTGGNTDFGQNSFGFDGSLMHRLSQHQRLGLSLHMGRTTGYLPQVENYAELFHEYQIYQNVALRTSYTFRKLKNSDPALTAGAFKAQGLDVSLSFDFSP